MNMKLKEWNKDSFKTPRVALMSGADGKSPYLSNYVTELLSKHGAGAKAGDLLEDLKTEY